MPAGSTLLELDEYVEACSRESQVKVGQCQGLSRGHGDCVAERHLPAVDDAYHLIKHFPKDKAQPFT